MRTNIVVDDKLVIDTLRGMAILKTKCITGYYELLHDDRDFDGFAQFLGLRVV